LVLLDLDIVVGTLTKGFQITRVELFFELLVIHIDPLDHTIWLPFNQAMMEAAEGLYVVKMPGWLESLGVRHERYHFIEAGKITRFIDWPDLAIIAN
jgi:hypothetical protein